MTKNLKGGGAALAITLQERGGWEETSNKMDRAKPSKPRYKIVSNADIPDDPAPGPALLEKLLPHEPLPIYCVINDERDAFREHEQIGPALTPSPLCAEMYRLEGGIIVPWEEAWPIVKEILERNTGPQPAWIRALRKQLGRTTHRFGNWLPDEPLPVYCALTDGFAWAETLSLGPMMSLVAQQAKRLMKGRFRPRALPWNEAWPLVRHHMINNYINQEMKGLATDIARSVSKTMIEDFERCGTVPRKPFPKPNPRAATLSSPALEAQTGMKSVTN